MFGDDLEPRGLPAASRRVQLVTPSPAEAELAAAAAELWQSARARLAAVVAAGEDPGPTRLAALAAADWARAAACDPDALAPSAPTVLRELAASVSGTPARRAALADLVSDGKPTLVFCDSAVLAPVLASELLAAGVPAAALSGSDRPGLRARVVERFGVDVQVLVCGPIGRLGLNLQKARRVVHFDVPLSAAHARQREGRARRLGGADVDVVFFASPGGADATLAASYVAAGALDGSSVSSAGTSAQA